MEALTPVYRIDLQVLIDNVTGPRMGAFGLTLTASAHCTGWWAVHAPVGAFGETVVVPAAVGNIFGI